MGTVRIVGGSLRGRRLRVADRGVRPTSERTREAIFDILGPERVEEASVLELFAGTGALGIEALSRGARSVDFVEGNNAVARRLTENLKSLDLEARGRVRIARLGHAGIPAGLSGPWALIFLDPPYDGEEGPRWVRALAESGALEPDGLLIYERRKGTVAPTSEGLTLATERTYGDTTIAIYRAGGPTETAPGGGT
ncbi:MAG: 16S rRNA (guanine(966)-N(2))-methyltransferase RsmD [Candidatus Eiseniibacteriota bacterium]